MRNLSAQLSLLTVLLLIMSFQGVQAAGAKFLTHDEFATLMVNGKYSNVRFYSGDSIKSMKQYIGDKQSFYQALTATTNAIVLLNGNEILIIRLYEDLSGFCILTNHS